MILGAIGIVAADEQLPYQAEKLYLIKDSEEYDLLEGITYDTEKYRLAVEDEGGFDIHVPGKYTVSYRLTSLTQSAEEGKMPVESHTAAPDISSGDAAQTPSADPTQTPSADPARTSSPDTAPMLSGTPDSIGFMRCVIVQEPVAQIRYEQDPLQLYPETTLYEAVSGKEAELGSDTAEIRYELQCKDSTLLTADAYVLDKSGEKVKDAAVTVKDDAGLRAASTVVNITVGGTETKVCRMEPGTYSITLASTDPDTGEEITAERTVEILPPEKMDYDLTQDVTVLKSEMSPQGGDATNLPALQIAQALLHNGYRVAAGVKQAAAPAEGELFAQADGFVLDPTDFTVNANGMDGAWTNDGTWFMENADGDNTRIVFRKDALIAKTPVQVTHNGVTQQFASYKEALVYIDTQAETAYTVTNLRSMDFTAEDIRRLDGASAGEKKKPGNRTADIDSKGVHTIQNLYNYDTLTLINGTLTIPDGQPHKTHRCSGGENTVPDPGSSSDCEWV